MAVEARHLTLFSPQILGNREMGSFVEANGNIYGGPMGYGVLPGPVSGTTTATENLIPMYGSATAENKTPMRSDSGLTYAIPVSRKRPRDNGINNQHHHHPLLSSSFPPNHHHQQNNDNLHQRCGGSFTFLGEDFSLQIQQQQFEIDRFIAQHTEKVMMDIEERRKRYSRRIIAAVEESIMKKLRAKEEEIQKIGKLNWALEERVKSLCVENQIWRDLAQTKEATANALRSNLEQVLAQVQQDDQQNNHRHHNAAELMDDAESCCGSNYEAENGIKEIDDKSNNGDVDGSGCGTMNNYNSRLCRNCGKEEPSVLFLPCRHLCLCSVCGPILHNCPICNCTKNGTLHVNLSSS